MHVFLYVLLCFLFSFLIVSQSPGVWTLCLIKMSCSLVFNGLFFGFLGRMDSETTGCYISRRRSLYLLKARSHKTPAVVIFLCRFKAIISFSPCIFKDKIRSSLLIPIWECLRCSSIKRQGIVQ